MAEAVGPVDPGSQWEFHFPAPHNREIVASRPPIGRDDVVEDFAWASAGDRDTDERAASGREQLQRVMGPAEKGEVSGRRHTEELRIDNVQTPRFDAVAARHEQRVRIGSPRRAVDDRVTVGRESRAGDSPRAESDGDEPGRGRGRRAARPAASYPECQRTCGGPGREHRDRREETTAAAACVEPAGRC